MTASTEESQKPSSTSPSDTEDGQKEQKKQADSSPQETNLKTWIVLVSVLSGSFLVALDRSIISTAIPAVTDEFHSLSGYGWYGSAYLLTSCAFQLLFGKIYTVFPVKTVYLSSILLFEAASALCGAAPTSNAFIIGRAFAGIGASGIFSGSIVCIVYVVPLHVRPKIQGLFGAFFGVASISGPLIGGGFTSNVTWRWCFYLNLPVGGAAMLIIALLLKIPQRDSEKLPLKDKLKQLDFPGSALFIPGIICLLLALQWGGQQYPWSEWRVILLLVLAGVLLLAFAAVQVWLPKTATLPPRLFKQRSVVASVFATFCISAANYIYIYYLPTYFQSIQGVDAATSGIHLLPTMISMIVCSLGGGFINSKVGYYTPLAIFGSSVMSIGAGLLTTLWIHTAEGKWIGYQIVYGVGMGLCFQVPNLAVQAVLPKAEVPIGLSLMLFSNLLGSTIFVSVGSNVLNNQLISRLSGIPGFNRELIATGGATSIVSNLPPADRQTALHAYNKSLQLVFQIALILCCLSVLGCAALEWKNVKKGKNNAATEEAKKEEEEKQSEGGAAGEEKAGSDASSDAGKSKEQV